MSVTADLAVSPRTTVLSGYNGSRRTLSSLADRWAWARIHPEKKRRSLSMWLSHPDTVRIGTDEAGLPIFQSEMGIGGGARNPVSQEAEFFRRHTTTRLSGRSSRTYKGVRYWLRPGMAPYAPPGSSNHEDGTLEGWAAAIDHVGWQDGWMVDNVHLFGLKTFDNVNDEPWHTQLVEFSNSKRDLLRDYAKGVRPGTPSLPFDPAPIAPPIVAEPPPQSEEDDEMPATLWRPYGYKTTFLTGAGSARPVTINEYTSMIRRGVPEVIDAKPVLDWDIEGQAAALKSALHQAGMTSEDLVKV